MNHKKFEYSKILVSYIIAALIAFLCITPIWVLIFNSFSNFAEYINVTHLTSVFTKQRTIQAFKFGLLISLSASFFSIIISMITSVILTKRQDIISNKIISIILLLSGLPISTLVIPLYFILYSMKLIDSISMIVLFLGSVHLPENILLFESTLSSYPSELKEVSIIDGVSPFAYIRRMLIPHLTPVFTGAFITTFINCWGNFIVPFILLSSSNKMPVAVSFFQTFSSYESITMSYLSSYALVYYFPVVILFIILRLGLTRIFVLNRFKT